MQRTCLTLLLCSLVYGQTPPKPAFEVASIRLAAPGSPMEQFERQYIHNDADRVNMGSVTLRQLIQMAYRVLQYQVVGPDWLSEEHFDVQAKLPAGTSTNDVPEMMQALLAERFGLAIHHEQKVVPAYALTVAKDGPKLHESAADDSNVAICDAGRKICHKMTMEMLANVLSRMARLGVERLNPWAIDKPVIDMTGLKGAYDFTMDYGPQGNGPAAAKDPDMVTAFEAVKSLGLKLEPTTHSDELIVIDHVERTPTAN